MWKFRTTVVTPPRAHGPGSATWLSVALISGPQRFWSLLDSAELTSLRAVSGAP
jgi:hypothetical protein